MDDETKNALEAVYGKISQLSDDLLGDKDKPGVFEAIRTVTSKIDSQIETVTQMGNDVRRLAWQQVATQNHVKSLTKKYEAWDDRLKRIESAPGQQALNQAETWKTWRRNFAMYLILGIISGSYGWWLGQQHPSQPRVPPAVVLRPQGESK